MLLGQVTCHAGEAEGEWLWSATDNGIETAEAIKREKDGK